MSGAWLMGRRTQLAGYVGFVFVSALFASALFSFSPLDCGVHVV